MSIVNELKRKNKEKKGSRYQTQLNRLKAKGFATKNIENTVNESCLNIKDGAKSFAIYGEPQSGKTEMMIALTAKLLDEGYQIILQLPRKTCAFALHSSPTKITPFAAYPTTLQIQ